MKVKCPCGAEVEVVRFGYGYVAHHCGRIIYNSDQPPPDEKEKGEAPNSREIK